MKVKLHIAKLVQIWKERQPVTLFLLIEFFFLYYLHTLPYFNILIPPSVYLLIGIVTATELLHMKKRHVLLICILCVGYSVIGLFLNNADALNIGMETVFYYFVYYFIKQFYVSKLAR
jgi:hypothetical protein